ncbi:MAG: hypothetical protein ACKVS9_13775 [Phycisphaerae bacterium]
MKPQSAQPSVPARRSWKRTLLRIALLSACTTTVTLIAFGCMLTHKPKWYRPAAIDYSKLEADKRTVVTLGDRIGDALNARKPIEFEITDEQLNRWIAAKDEWPTGRDLDFAPFQQPYVEFLDDNRVRIAATVTQRGISLVASFVGQVAIEAEHVVVTVDSLHAGAAPLPWSRIEAALQQALGEHDEGHADGHTDAHAGGHDGASRASNGKLRFDNHFVWPNGRRNYRISEISTTAGRAKLTLQPQ